MIRFSHIALVLPLLLLLGTSAMGQNYLERTVIGSAGTEAVGFQTQTSLTYTVGEAVTFFGESNTYSLTQGFQQSNYVQDDPIIVDFTNVMNESCIGAENGALSIELFGCPGPYQVTWSNGDTGTVINELAAGEYTVSVTGANGCMVENSFTLERDLEAFCALEIYTGITPNGDGFNDEWIIDNIQFFPGNEVSIHTRSGAVVWNATDYDNDLVVWSGKDNNGNDLGNDTYWYVVEIDGRKFTGWVELTL